MRYYVTRTFLLRFEPFRPQKKINAVANNWVAYFCTKRGNISRAKTTNIPAFCTVTALVLSTFSTRMVRCQSEAPEAAAATGEQSETKRKCTICSRTFEYRNELFRHLETSDECGLRSGFVARHPRPELTPSPTSSLEWSTLFQTPGLHEDLRAYFARAAQDRLDLFVTARTLVAATSREVVQSAWDAGVLQCKPIGRTGTYREHERAEWLQKALSNEAPEGYAPESEGEWDLSLSPRLTNTEATPEMLVLILHHFERHNSWRVDSKSVREFANRAWDVRASNDEWRRIARRFPEIFDLVRRAPRARHRKEEKVLLRPNARGSIKKFDIWAYEENFFRFLHQSRGGSFFRVSSLEHSLAQYKVNEEPGALPAVISDALLKMAIKDGYIIFDEDKCVHFEPRHCRSPVCCAPVTICDLQTGNETRCGCSQAHMATELIAKNDHVALPPGTSLIARDSRTKELLSCDSGDVYNTSGAREFFRLQESFGRALSRNLCSQGAQCAESSSCRHIHLKTVVEEATTLDTTKDFENMCSVEPATLRSILVYHIRTGQLRVELQEIMRVWRERDSTITEDDIMWHVDNGIASGQLVPFVVARTGSEACILSVYSKTVSAMAFRGSPATSALFLSPVLRAPPRDLLHPLHKYFCTEKAQCTIGWLKYVCGSHFALRLGFQDWCRLANESKGEFKFVVSRAKNDRLSHLKKSLLALLRRNTNSPHRTKPTGNNVEERIKQLDQFVGAYPWPSCEVLLESAKRFGHESLRPAPGKRSRMHALRWLLQEVAKKRGVPFASFFENKESIEDDFEDDCGMQVASFTESNEDIEDDFDNECGMQVASLSQHDKGKASDFDDDHNDYGINVGSLSSPWSPPMAGVNVTYRRTRSNNMSLCFNWIDFAFARYHPHRAHTHSARVVRQASDDHLARFFSNQLTHGLPQKIDATVANNILRRCGSAAMDLRVECVSRDLLVALVLGAINQQDQMRMVAQKRKILSDWCRAKASLRGQGRVKGDRRQVIGLLLRSPKLVIAHATRVGSVGLGIDTALSDHDILIELENGGTDMVERVYDAVLELQRDAFVVTHFLNFANAVVKKGTFAVSISCYRRSIEFDVVPVTSHPDKQIPGLWHWSPLTQTWKENMMRQIATRLQSIVATLPNAFHAMRLVKMWNESQLPKLRVSSHSESALKSPLVGIHMVLLMLQAHQMGAFAEHETTEQSLKAMLWYIKVHWDDVTVPEGGLVFAQGYFTEIHAKYEASPRMLAEFPGLISHTVQRWEALCDKCERLDHDGNTGAVEGEWDVSEVEAMLAEAADIVGKIAPNPCSKGDWGGQKSTPHVAQRSSP
eukprot:GEMP01000819.1.p1 GENE.GEMP01000819.1~~GEMP01000819.1.p1  ORF type:complete len:1331 (+),score=284.02 GEMP01000819.1:167-4159(+)